MMSDINKGKLYFGDLKYLPATAQSILSIIKYYKLDIKDKKITIVGRSLIVGLPVYYDTPNNWLIRNSLAKENYKEKIRLRSYGLAKVRDTITVYLELKRKANGLVYKRRISSTIDTCERFMKYDCSIGNGQIAKEIINFRDFYKNLQKNYLIL